MRIIKVEVGIVNLQYISLNDYFYTKYLTAYKGKNSIIL